MKEYRDRRAVAGHVSHIRARRNPLLKSGETMR
jgi:hypothetical protein